MRLPLPMVANESASRISTDHATQGQLSRLRKTRTTHVRVPLAEPEGIGLPRLATSPVGFIARDNIYIGYILKECYANVKRDDFGCID
jgi:hypothetical protein